MNKAVLIRLGFAFAAAIGLVSCARETESPLPVPLPEPSPDEAIQQINLNLEETDLGVGETVALSFSCTPEEIVPQVVKWNSTNAAVASVDEKGVVTALSPGVTYVTASAGHLADSALVNVYQRRIPATAIRLSRTQLGMKPGRRHTLKASLLPENSTDKNNFSWSSSRESVATVSDGVVQAAGAGEAVITVRHKDLKDSIRVTVADNTVYTDVGLFWPLTAPASQAPRWAWDADRNPVGALEDVCLDGCDSYYHYFAVVHADQFDGIEKAAEDLTALIAVAEADGEDAALLFRKGAADTLSYTYPQAGNAVAYVLGADEDLELTGEYSLVRFKTRMPDPIPATGIRFWQGNAPISQLSLNEGERLEGVYARFLPDYCTDNWKEIRFAASDGYLLSVGSQAGSCTLEGRFKGQTGVTASYGSLSASLPVTVIRPDDGRTDCSDSWKGRFGAVQLWGFDTFGFTLESCSSPFHVLRMIPAQEMGDGFVYARFKELIPEVEKAASGTVSSSLPDEVAGFGYTAEGEYYVFVYGMKADGKTFDGNYAIYHHIPAQ